MNNKFTIHETLLEQLNDEPQPQLIEIVKQFKTEYASDIQMVATLGTKLSRMYNYIRLSSDIRELQDLFGSDTPVNKLTQAQMIVLMILVVSNYSLVIQFDNGTVKGDQIQGLFILGLLFVQLQPKGVNKKKLVSIVVEAQRDNNILSNIQDRYAELIKKIQPKKMQIKKWDVGCLSKHNMVYALRYQGSFYVHSQFNYFYSILISLLLIFQKQSLDPDNVIYNQQITYMNQDGKMVKTKKKSKKEPVKTTMYEVPESKEECIEEKKVKKVKKVKNTDKLVNNGPKMQQSKMQGFL